MREAGRVPFSAQGPGCRTHTPHAQPRICWSAAGWEAAPPLPLPSLLAWRRPVASWRAAVPPPCRRCAAKQHAQTGTLCRAAPRTGLGDLSAKSTQSSTSSATLFSRAAMSASVASPWSSMYFLSCGRVGWGGVGGGRGGVPRRNQAQSGAGRAHGPPRLAPPPGRRCRRPPGRAPAGWGRALRRSPSPPCCAARQGQPASGRCTQGGRGGSSGSAVHAGRQVGGRGRAAPTPTVPRTKVKGGGEASRAPEAIGLALDERGALAAARARHRLLCHLAHLEGGGALGACHRRRAWA